MTRTGAPSQGSGPFRPPDIFDIHTLTVLAWRRTALRIALIAVAGAQLLALVYGPAAYTLAVVGLVVGLTLHLSVSRRYRVAARQMREGREHAGLGGARFRVAVLSVFAGIIAVAALAWMLIEAFA
ncbi:hypothetical protein [Demequina globuliformis]|uniref:hypothetical protein n=1 Tax=Demequina globuliformis TaxID=676202 RepID=UPI000785EBA2|nr:hypothetical protein [Demequina globuliformis]